MGRLEFVEAGESQSPEPVPRPICPVGIAGHRWILTIEEGTPTFALAPGEVCPPCVDRYDPKVTLPVCMDDVDWFELETREMDALPVKLWIERAGQPPDGEYPILRIEPTP